jgi:tripartite ATP-independent transporter DctM subunit
MELALVGFVALFALLFLGVPIAFGMGLVGLAGFASLVGAGPALDSLGQLAVDSMKSYGLSVLPLFLLMGNFITRARLSDDLYTACHAFIGHRRGGLAMATIVACGGVSAVCGSSLATVATMSRIAMPPMRRYGYAQGLAAGSIAAGGTLGILIPPSIILVIYGNLTETDIGRLFVAGIVPGLLGIALYSAAVQAVTAVRPEAGPAADAVPVTERWRSLRAVWGVVALFVLVIGGIYLGVFTPTEAAGIGAAGAFLFAVGRRRFGPRALFETLVETASMSGKLMILILGADLFSNFINLAGLPNALAGWVQSQTWPLLGVLLGLMGAYLLLGCVLDGLSIVLLTVPVVFPLVVGLGADPVWFGILLVIAVEVGLITPPIGLNVFVMRSILPEVPTAVIYRGIAPFIVSDVVRLALILFVPSLALYLPSLMN